MINFAYGNAYETSDYSTELWVGAISVLLLGFLVGYLLGRNQTTATKAPAKKTKK